MADTGSGSGFKLLNLETTYSLETIRERKLEHEITCRDLDGFFDHVWSVHPIVGASSEHSPSTAVGPPSAVRIAERHTMIEGRIGRFRWLNWLPPLNFILAQLALVFRLTRLIRTQRISMIRTGDPYYNSMLGLLLARLTGLPLVVRINGNPDSVYEATGVLAYPRLLRWRKVEQRVARLVLERADLVASASEDNQRFALNNGASPSRCTVFRYGTWIDPLHFSTEPEDRRPVRSELGLGERPFLILVSRLEKLKHPEDVVLTVAEVKRHVPNFAGVLVGDGSMREELESMAAELGIADDVCFVSNRDQPWIAAALTSSTVVVSPLTGRALVEACLSGTPVVAYDVEWHPELISNGETGILVPYRDVGAMSVAVHRLVEQPSMAAAMGQKARSATLHMMDPVRLMEHERSEYRKLLDTRAGKAGR